jgi:2-polyprenyl-3-methyl-5-hydroxy-6-metoxy-1,4-benzoquinol methylase
MTPPQNVATHAPATVDPAKVEAFVGKVLGDSAGLTTTLIAAIGDRLGLYKDLAKNGPATSAELAARAGIDERYSREWLAANQAAGYLAYDPTTRKFTLPPEHAPALAEEKGPHFFGGVYEMIVGMSSVYEDVVKAFKTGRGVRQDQYPPTTYSGMSRFTDGWFENLLIPVWIPAVPAVHQALQRGISVADVGCGRGRALLKLAQAFPKSRFVGFDVYGPNVKQANKEAREAGVADRVQFFEKDVSKGLPNSYDLITTFDVVHDAVDPKGLLRTIRKALKPGGTYLNLDINCSEKVEENGGPLGAFFYGASVFYCMTTSLAHGGEALGTCGLSPAKLNELGQEAGFRKIRKLPLDNPFNNLYELQS